MTSLSGQSDRLPLQPPPLSRGRVPLQPLPLRSLQGRRSTPLLASLVLGLQSRRSSLTSLQASRSDAGQLAVDFRRCGRQEVADGQRKRDEIARMWRCCGFAGLRKRKSGRHLRLRVFRLLSVENLIVENGLLVNH